MLLANLDMRIDSAVSRHVLPEPKRLAAVRTLLVAFGALFALVALVSTVNGDWAFAALYGVLAGWVAVCIRRFLSHTAANTNRLRDQSRSVVNGVRVSRTG
jgi:F0F1-type ATP synthase assembly protein I